MSELPGGLECCRYPQTCPQAATTRGQVLCDQLIKAHCKKPENRYSDECACLRRPPRDALSNLSHCVDAACRRQSAFKLSHMWRTPCPSAVDCVQKVFVVGSGSGEQPAVLAGITTEQVCTDGTADDPSIKGPRGVGDKKTPVAAPPMDSPGQDKHPSAARAWNSILGWTPADGIAAAITVVLIVVVAVSKGGAAGFAGGVVLGVLLQVLWWRFIVGVFS